MFRKFVNFTFKVYKNLNMKGNMIASGSNGAPCILQTLT